MNTYCTDSDDFWWFCNSIPSISGYFAVLSSSKHECSRSVEGVSNFFSRPYVSPFKRTNTSELASILSHLNSARQGKWEIHEFRSILPLSLHTTTANNSRNTRTKYEKKRSFIRTCLKMFSRLTMRELLVSISPRSMFEILVHTTTVGLSTQIAAHTLPFSSKWIYQWKRAATTNNGSGGGGRHHRNSDSSTDSSHKQQFLQQVPRVTYKLPYPKTLALIIQSARCLNSTFFYSLSQ